MKKLSFTRRLQLVAAGIDFLLNHPKLKFSDILAGIMILRHTVLFGKLSDTMILRQLSQGVRNLNRGTGRTPRRLSLAGARLAEVGFLRATKKAHYWQGTNYELCGDAILRSVEELRRPNSMADSAGEQDCRRNDSPDSPYDSAPLRPGERHRRSPADQESKTPAAPTAADVDALRNQLNDLKQQLRLPLRAVEPWTCVNLLEAARRAKADATPEEIVWFIREKVVDRRGRFRSWGGVVTAVREDFGV
jgi:hypothetical protein